MTGKPTWAECHAAGMTARQAAEARGMATMSAYGWSKRRGLRWTDAVRVPVTVRGTTYPSQAAAAAALGIGAPTISALLNRHGHCDTAGLGHAVKVPLRGGDHGMAKPITIGGTTYGSHIEAARALGVSRSRLHRMVYGGQREALVQLLMRREATAIRANMRLAEMVDGVKYPGRAA